MDCKSVQKVMDSVKKHLQGKVIEGAMRMLELREVKATWEDWLSLASQGMPEKSDGPRPETIPR